MKKRVRLLTDFRLSEVSVVDHPACEKSAITSVQLVKRSEQPVDQELNSEELKAVDLQPDDAGPIRKFIRFLMTAPKQEPVEKGFKTPDPQSHGGLVPPSDSSDERKEPGGEMNLLDTGLGKDDDMGDSAKTGDVSKREFTQAQRDSAADSGAALPDGSFPIHNKSDLENAIRAIGRAKDPARAKAHIKSRARALGATDLLPDTWKSAQASKSLYSVSQFAQTVMAIDMCAQNQLMDGTLEQGDDTDNELARKLSALRDQAGQILIEMCQHEVGEFNGGEKMASANVEELAKALLDAMRNKQELEKKGAKFSADTVKCMKSMSGCFNKAGGYFSKASGKYPDDDDLNSGLTHFAAGMHHMSKIDFEGREVEGGMNDVSQSDANPPSKAANADDIAKTVADAVAKAIAGNLEKVQAAAHAFEVENAGLRARLETLGQMPARSTIKVGNPSLTSKTAADEALARQAGRSSEPEINIDPADDRKVSKGGVPINFAKSFALARREPMIIMGKPSLGGGA